MNDILRAGAREAGFRDAIPAVATELEAIQGLLKGAKRGDVCAVMAHVERAEIFAWLAEEGFRQVGPERLRELVAG